LLAATTLAVVTAAALGGGMTAHAAGLCAFPTSSGGGPITVSGTTATATFDVVSVPCTVNLVSYQSQTGGTRVPIDSVAQTYTATGHYTLQVHLLCGTDNQIELFVGSPPPSAGTDIGAFSVTPSCGSGGAFTQGYWKNHPSAWPGSVLVGTTTVSVSQGIDILQTPPKGGDATLILAHQLIAAELNVAGGADSSCIASTIAAANALLAAHPVGSGLKSSSTDGATATQLASTLDDYNSGKLCAASGE
jgi:hypothetical protein